MPIYESYCGPCGVRFEWFSKSFTEDNPPCGDCGNQTVRLISPFAIVFTGAITTRYNDKSKENGEIEGHWAYRVRSSISGQPEAVWIDSWQKQKDFCREEGLINPKELPTNAEVSTDGKKLQSAGMPGAWV